ncbi:MAG: GatB/YqeY domain-containing protein [Pseudomonadota bacterium]
MRQKINDAYKDAMKSQDKLRTSTLRLINAAIKDKDIEARGSSKPPISDEEILGLMQKMVKQRHESAGIYAKAGRIELANQENDEIKVIESFMPAQMSEAEMTAAVEAAISSTGAAEMKDMGKVMAELKGKYAGQIDFGKANAVIKQKLSA